eukprot:GHVP01047410.1.p1 GENE.GHVP01047410.1~~GHVP01047410.1.p1  ORF type:complete len:545 (+),score=99.43 GHVP01047410.1:368-2002(+)
METQTSFLGRCLKHNNQPRLSNNISEGISRLVSPKTSVSSNLVPSYPQPKYPDEKITPDLHRPRIRGSRLRQGKPTGDEDPDCNEDLYEDFIANKYNLRSHNDGNLKNLEGTKSLSQYSTCSSASSTNWTFPAPEFRRRITCQPPINFSIPPTHGASTSKCEIRPWPEIKDLVLSQNSSKRRVHRGVWMNHNDLQSSFGQMSSFVVAVKFVDDENPRDGRSIKREVECHLFIHQKIREIQKFGKYSTEEDAWPCSELFGYFLDKNTPGKTVLVTRKLSGPDFFDVIRTENSSSSLHRESPVVSALYEYQKLRWCTIAAQRILEFATLGIRHNDIKPDNICLDFFQDSNGRHRIDVKLIDLGTASMHSAKDFTGGTSWYESPEQKILEYFTKKEKDQESARAVDIGLPSDLWGAGLSITEVLVGRRIVDSMKPPYGPGPLDFRGYNYGWAVQPTEWIEMARRTLDLHKEPKTTKFPLCYEAARQIFDGMVVKNQSKRMSLAEARTKLAAQAKEAYHNVLFVSKKHGEIIDPDGPCHFAKSLRKVK